MPDQEADDSLPSPPHDILQSWKEIAAYLNATERSAQRWEQLEGLPVHRQARSRRAAVYAYKSEIEAWRRRRSEPPAAFQPAPDEPEDLPPPPARPSGRRLAWWAAGAAAALLAGGWMWLGWGRSAEPPALVSAKPLPDWPGLAVSPALSPDGSKIAFGWRTATSAGFALAVADVAGGEPRVLTDSAGNETSPAWSPNGSRLAYCRTAAEEGSRVAEVVILPAEGGPEKVLARVGIPTRFTPWSFGSYLAWTADGSALITPPPERGKGNGLFRIDVETGQAQPLTEPGPGLRDGAPSVSPDGRHLAFLRNLTPIQTDLYALDLQTEGAAPVRLTREGAWAGPPTFTPDSAFVLATTGKFSGARRALALEPSGRRPPVELAGAPENLYALSASRDLSAPRLVGFQGRLDVDLYRAVLEGTDAHIEKLLTMPGVQGMPAISPDGSRIAFESTGGGQPEGLWVANRDGEDARPLVTAIGMLGGPAAWSPDGRTLAASATDAEGQHVYAVNANDGAIRALTAGPERTFPPRWRADGAALLFSTADASLLPQPLSLAYPEGPSESVSREEAVMLEPVGATGAYAMVSNSRDLTLHRDGVSEPLARLYWRHSFQAAGEAVYFLRHNGRRRPPTAEVHDVRTGRSRVLAQLPWVWRGFAVSPDGSAIYFDRLEAESAGLTLLELGR
ncbi:MAG: hypothetical protein GC160_02155 [Acidobacteria bacterium]|nr:hypothetical protein [Acidobacteriota bacterium]